MRFSAFRFGTERYPDKVARRLRAVNVIVCLGATVTTIFALLRLSDPAPGMRQHGLTDAAEALIFLAIPLLHRFSPLAAPLALIIIVYAILFRTTLVVGTGGGSYLYYFSVAAFVTLIIGTDRVFLTAAASAVAAALVILLHLIVPRETGFVSRQAQFYGNFVTNVVANAAILFVVVQYAVRQIARAEAATEREYTRSESLLANILPPSVAERLKERPGTQIADHYAEASILFADMEGFTVRASDTPPHELVTLLNGVFTRIDGVVERHGLEKIRLPAMLIWWSAACRSRGPTTPKLWPIWRSRYTAF